jgi:hypothetical protein
MVGTFICNIVLGDLPLRLILEKSSNLDGWTYAVVEVNTGRFLVPEPPVADLETGKHCAEAVVSDNFAFSQINFHWEPSSTGPR